MLWCYSRTRSTPFLRWSHVRTGVAKGRILPKITRLERDRTESEFVWPQGRPTAMCLGPPDKVPRMSASICYAQRRDEIITPRLCCEKQKGRWEWKCKVSDGILTWTMSLSHYAYFVDYMGTLNFEGSDSECSPVSWRKNQISLGDKKIRKCGPLQFCLVAWAVYSACCLSSNRGLLLHSREQLGGDLTGDPMLPIKK